MDQKILNYKCKSLNDFIKDIKSERIKLFYHFFKGTFNHENLRSTYFRITS
jgi:hypothetical protein